MKTAVLSYLLTVFIAIVAVACLAAALSPAMAHITDAFSIISKLFSQVG